jgi:hypothetical protein
MSDAKPIVKQVEGGQFQARYADSPPNVFGIGDSREAAVAALEQKKIAHAAVGSPEANRESVEVVQSVEATTDRVIVIALPEQRTATENKFVAYRESRPDVQGYGIDRVKAKAALFQKEFESGQEKPAAPKEQSGVDKPSKE